MRNFLPPGRTDVLALDLETTGLQAADPNQEVTLLGLADRTGVGVVDWRSLSQEDRAYVFARFRERKLTAFNVVFDSAWIERERVAVESGQPWRAHLALTLDTERMFVWEMCSLVLFRYLANEGFHGQTWNLAALQELLGWPPDGQKAWLKDALKKHKLIKDEMWKLVDLEPEQFAIYCGIDADAAYQGYQYLADTCRRLGKIGSTSARFHKTCVLPEIQQLVRQQLRGIQINTEKLQQYRAKLAGEIEVGVADFLNHPECKPHVSAWNEAATLDHLDREPEKLTKTGKVSVRWQKWDKKRQIINNTQHFNVNSTQHLAWLFFDKLKYEPAKLTATGAPAVSKDVLPQYGEPGRVLAGVKKKIKELSYVDACLAACIGGVLHPQMKGCGTVSGRLAGGS